VLLPRRAPAADRDAVPGAEEASQARGWQVHIPVGRLVGRARRPHSPLSLSLRVLGLPALSARAHATASPPSRSNGAEERLRSAGGADGRRRSGARHARLDFVPLHLLACFRSRPAAGWRGCARQLGAARGLATHLALASRFEESDAVAARTTPALMPRARKVRARERQRVRVAGRRARGTRCAAFWRALAGVDAWRGAARDAACPTRRSVGRPQVRRCAKRACTSPSYAAGPQRARRASTAAR
jgi:hypothetical protein